VEEGHDGHDFGSTEDPLAVFGTVQKIDESAWPDIELKAAYRLKNQESYVCLWPPELSHFQVA
jgi:hypothetical protein